MDNNNLYERGWRDGHNEGLFEGKIFAARKIAELLADKIDEEAMEFFQEIIGGSWHKLYDGFRIL